MLGPLRSRRTRLVAPGVLAALAGACSSAATADPVAHVEAAFPAHAPAALGDGTPGFAATSHGFAPIAATPVSRVAVASSRPSPTRVSVELPALASDEVVMHAREGLDVRVREVGATGVGVIARGAIVYARAGVASYWTQNQGVAEEWAHLDAAHVRAGEPVLVWEVAGARLAQAGDAVDVLEPNGRVALQVVAPAAYGDGERAVRVRLRAIGARIELFADAGGEALLVDPMWIPAASLPAPTYNHAAALLQTGEVLVAGGEPGIVGGEYNTAEVYDPTADTWTPVGNMFVARTNHTATTLTDGTVLEVGGVINGGGLFLASAETYDPAAQTFTGVGSMSTARANHRANLLEDERVLVTGGYTANCGSPFSIPDCEVYDPNLAPPSWSFTDPMFTARARHTATELVDGRVLVAGGDSDGVTSLSEIWDPASGHWTETSGALTDARENAAAVLLGDGTVLVEGGDDGTDPFASAEIYDPVGDTWTEAAPLAAARTKHTATVLPSGLVLVVGGEDATASLASTEIYDPVAKTWSAGPPLMEARSEHTATLLAGGDVLVAGGDGASSIATCERFHTVVMSGCTTDQDCPVDDYCDDATCLPQKADGQPAAASDQCTSRVVADGVCCDHACAAPCGACSVAAGSTVDGTCTDIHATCDDGDACTTGDQCSGGTCVGVAKLCPPMDICHQAGTCDSATGDCTPVAKPDGAMCDDGNPCTKDTCQTGVCVSVNDLDGTLCTGGVCIAGECVLDPATGASSSSESAASTTATSGAGGAATGVGGGGGGGADTHPELSGGGCSAQIAPGRPEGWLVALGLAVAALGVRRKPRR